MSESARRQGWRGRRFAMLLSDGEVRWEGGGGRMEMQGKRRETGAETRKRGRDEKRRGGGQASKGRVKGRGGAKG